MKRLLARLAALALFAGPTIADEAGVFDYYVMALSWSPTWCALEGDARDADQCDPRYNFGWTLHGLWPQFESGYPQDCATTARDPSRRQSDDMADIMGSGGLAWYQWKKHGRCSGLDGPDYYALSRQAYDAVARPPVLRQLDRTVALPAQVVEDAFLESNPRLTDEMIRSTCQDGHIDEIRICLTRDLQPRPCGADARQDCRLTDALLPPIR
jgi:ribonuclease T2